MSDLTVIEVLEYSRDIEMESYRFYTKVAKDESLTELEPIASELAAEELDHYNRINKILEGGRITAAEADQVVELAEEHMRQLVGTRELPAEPTVRAILEAALARELATEGVYRTLLSMTNISDDVVEVFSRLVTQEQGHAARIRSLIEKHG